MGLAFPCNLICKNSSGRCAIITGKRRKFVSKDNHETAGSGTSLMFETVPEPVVLHVLLQMLITDLNANHGSVNAAVVVFYHVDKLIRLVGYTDRRRIGHAITIQTDAAAEAGSAV